MTLLARQRSRTRSPDNDQGVQKGARTFAIEVIASVTPRPATFILGAIGAAFLALGVAMAADYAWSNCTSFYWREVAFRWQAQAYEQKCGQSRFSRLKKWPIRAAP
jgi:hypothetical protein